MTSELKRRGTCHVFADNVPLDEGVMSFKFAIGRVTDPQLLIPHLFECLDPELPKKIKQGDIVIAGRQFGCGKAHMQGFIAMAALGMSVLCESMPTKTLRGAIAKGVPIMTGCAGARAFAQSGDEIEVDFTTGDAVNHSRGTSARFSGMPPILIQIASQGGMLGLLKNWLDAHPDLKRAEGAGGVLPYPGKVLR